jgi:hypothetical protein
MCQGVEGSLWKLRSLQLTANKMQGPQVLYGLKEMHSANEQELVNRPSAVKYSPAEKAAQPAVV